MFSPPDFKILIASTPKTGNTWLRHLLAAIYDLPTVELGLPFDPDAASALGQRWITHQHYAPEPALLEWARRNNVILMTTIRHPGDVLLSLYHYVHSYNEQLDFYQLARLAEDDGTFGAPVRSILHTVFKDLIAISVAWKATGAAHMVEYEALYFDPVDTLTRLTNAILPVSRDRIERAVERCNIGAMRALAYENRLFFRQGGYGHWRKVLPADIIDLLRTTDPYPAQFAALGYALDAEDKWSGAVARHPPAKADFFEQFGHSPAMTSLLKTIYLSFDSAEARRRWPDIAGAGAPTAFHTWLNQPAEADPNPPGRLPLITNLAAQIYRLRMDLQEAFPDLYGLDRYEVAFWMIVHAASGYQLDQAYVTPLRQALLEWATRPDAQDPALHAGGAGRHADVLDLSNLAVHFYLQRPDLQAAFPDLYGEHRVDFVRWFIEHAGRECGVEQACLEPLRRAFTAWAARPDARDPVYTTNGEANGQTHLPVLTNFAAHAHRSRPDLRTAFPDLYGRHRIDVLLWLVENACREYQLDDACIAPLRRHFLAWALHSLSGRSSDRYGKRRFAYLCRYLLARRPLRGRLRRYLPTGAWFLAVRHPRGRR